jgi:hypothetical protein
MLADVLRKQIVVAVDAGVVVGHEEFVDIVALDPGEFVVFVGGLVLVSVIESFGQSIE